MHGAGHIGQAVQHGIFDHRDGRRQVAHGGRCVVQQAPCFAFYLRPAAARGVDLRRDTVALQSRQPLTHYRAGLRGRDAGRNSLVRVRGEVLQGALRQGQVGGVIPP